jgi:hypothetical protein
VDVVRFSGGAIPRLGAGEVRRADYCRHAVYEKSRRAASRPPSASAPGPLDA